MTYLTVIVRGRCLAICLFDETGLLVSAEINDAVSGVINYVITSETDEQNNKICTVSVQDADDHKKYVFDSSGREIYSEEFDKEYGCMKYTETVITEYECEDKNVKYMYVTRTLLPDVKTAYEECVLHSESGQSYSRDIIYDFDRNEWVYP